MSNNTRTDGDGMDGPRPPLYGQPGVGDVVELATQLAEAVESRRRLSIHDVVIGTLSAKVTSLEKELAEEKVKVAELQARGSALHNDNAGLRAIVRSLKSLDYTSRRADVMNLYRIYGREIPAKPHVPADDVIRRCASGVVEETFELLEAIFGEKSVLVVNCALNDVQYIALHQVKKDVLAFIKNPTMAGEVNDEMDLEETVDALTDITVFAEGFFIALGVDSGPVWDGVQKANEAPGWKAFDVGAELDRQGRVKS